MASSLKPPHPHLDLHHDLHLHPPMLSPALHPHRPHSPYPKFSDDDSIDYFSSVHGETKKEPCPEVNLFLGLDCSTQALKATIISGNDLKVRGEEEVRFDRDLPEFNTTQGVHMGPPGSGLVTSPVKMLVKSLDLLLTRLKNHNVPLHLIRSISGAGQQHASVYFSRNAERILGTSLDSRKSLEEQLLTIEEVEEKGLDPSVDACFSRSTVPNWQDSSTTQECRELEQFVGGSKELAQKTGSKAHTRFTGSQILKFRREDDGKGYEETGRICLVSSFLCTLMGAGGSDDDDDGGSFEIIKPLDESDACGMNLYNITSSSWDKDLLSLVSGEAKDEKRWKGLGGVEELERKLGRVERDCGKVVGKVGKWLRDRFGFDKDCFLIPFTGDNPSTLLSFHSLSHSDAVISLGTSDTVLLSTKHYKPGPDYHVFTHPASMGGEKEEEKGFMAMLCYKNGSLVREWVRDQINGGGGDWEKFNRFVEMDGGGGKTGEEGEKRRVGFYFLKPEILPYGASGIHRFENSKPVDHFSSGPSQDASVILNSQFTSFRVRVGELIRSEEEEEAKEKEEKSSRFQQKGVDSSSSSPDLRMAFAVGGAANNPTIVQRLADVLGCPIYKPEAPEIVEPTTTSTSIDIDTKNNQTENKSKRKKVDANSCSVGAAYKAVWAFERLNRNGNDVVIESDGDKNGKNKKKKRVDSRIGFGECMRMLYRRRASKTTIGSAQAGGGGSVTGESDDGVDGGSKLKGSDDNVDELELEGIVKVAEPDMKKWARVGEGLEEWKELEREVLKISLLRSKGKGQ